MNSASGSTMAASHAGYRGLWDPVCASLGGGASPFSTCSACTDAAAGNGNDDDDARVSSRLVVVMAIGGRRTGTSGADGGGVMYGLSVDASGFSSSPSGSGNDARKGEG